MDKRAKMVACFDNQIEQMGLVHSGLRPLELKSVIKFRTQTNSIDKNIP